MEDAVIAKDGARAVGEDDGEQPATHIGKAQCDSDGPRCFYFRAFDLLGDVRGRVVVGHCPGGGEEAEEEGEAGGRPAGVGDDFGPDIGVAVFVLAHGEEGDAAGYEHPKVEDDVAAGYALEEARVHAVENGMEEDDGGHDADSLAWCGFIFEAAFHRDCGEEELRATVFGRGKTGRLSEDIEPATEPADLGHPCFGREVLAGEVETARCWVGGDQFRDRQRNSHTPQA